MLQRGEQLAEPDPYHIPDGTYQTPQIGPWHGLDDYPESSLYVERGQIGIDSALWGDKRLLRDIFRDPRAAAFADAFVRHQFHHLDTRQLALSERFETRDGAGRMDRLTTIIDSARMAVQAGGTFEQTVQVLLSDTNVTVGSHRLGDHLVGDYCTEGTRDEDIADYITRSGLFGYLMDRRLIDSGGRLTGSPETIAGLSQPNNPRQYDIVECPRPDSNSDRDPFTLIEGLYLEEPEAVQETAHAIVPVEILHNGERQIRLGYAGDGYGIAKTGRRYREELLYKLSVRHMAEHWGNPEHNAVSELVSAGDKHRLLAHWPYDPVDVVRTSESSWFNDANPDEFSMAIYALSERLARRIKEVTHPVQTGKVRFAGPGTIPIPGMTFRKLPKDIPYPDVSVSRDTVYDTQGELRIRLPRHKYRRPINPLIVFPHGMFRATELRGDLEPYARRHLQWLGSYGVRIVLPWNEIGGLADGLKQVNVKWNLGENNRRPDILMAQPMQQTELTAQIDRARRAVIARAAVSDIRAA